MKSVRNRLRSSKPPPFDPHSSSSSEVLPTSIVRQAPKDKRLSSSSAASSRLILFIVISSACLVVYAIHVVWFRQPSSSSNGWSWSLLSFSSPIVPSEPNTTLALVYPPGFLGGYRNQVIRLMGWVSYAVEHGYRYLYLPSILWRTQMQQFAGEPWYPIPMELIFDIDYWNLPQFSHALPQLVRKIHRSDCWTTEIDPSIRQRWSSLHPLQQASLQQGALRPIINTTHSSIVNVTLFNPRKVDLLSQLSMCQHPVAYGGGKGAGLLWNDYLRYRNNRTASARLPKDVDHFILRALRPAPQWRTLAEGCVRGQIRQHGTSATNYLALHARVEVEMMAHTCGAEMNWNLTNIFEQVAEYLTLYNKEADDGEIGGVFVAVSRDGIQANVSSGPWQRFKPYADENLAALDRLVGDREQKGEGLLGGSVTVFECGKHMMDQFYASHPKDIYYGSLLEQVINFYIAVSAKVFVGVKHSSYSTDVWTTRYYQGRGSANFHYTRNGRIKPVENGGLPTPHGNCAKRKRKPK